MVTVREQASAGETTYGRETRARILAAAERRFKHYGYAKTSIVDIASDCAMSHANVYRFFRNKTSLVDAIASVWLTESERVCRDVVDLPLPAGDRLIAFVLTLHRWKLGAYVRNSRAYELLTVASHEQRPFVGVHLAVLADLLVEIIEDGNARDDFDERDPRRLAASIGYATSRFCNPWQVAAYAHEPLEDQARDVMTLLVAGIPRKSSASTLAAAKTRAEPPNATRTYR